MTVIRAEVMGMCAGVRRALQIARAIQSPREVTILGELVHNEQVADELAQRGFVSLATRERTPATPLALIPAHGISRRESQRLRAAGKQLVDATCPFVQKIHHAAQTLRKQGRMVIVIGKKGHAEVEGIVEDLQHSVVVSDPCDVTAYDTARLGVVCQSTVSLATADGILSAIHDHNPGADISYLPTICPATRERQTAALALLDEVDAVVVVGGTNSNNTLELVELVRDHGTPCFHVQTEADIYPEWFEGMDVVGLTAGASTPDNTIEAVYRCLGMLPSTAGVSGVLAVRDGRT